VLFCSRLWKTESKQKIAIFAENRDHSIGPGHTAWQRRGCPEVSSSSWGTPSARRRRSGTFGLAPRRQDLRPRIEPTTTAQKFRVIPPICNIASTKLHTYAVKQGYQIGRTFAHRAIVYVGQFCENYKKQSFGQLFSPGKSNLFILAKKWVGLLFG
jgi:hypothetical protein